VDNLTNMAIFARVVEAESFTAAASVLGMSKSAVSKAVSALDRLGAQLLNRTTRRLALTEVGSLLYEHCARSVAEAEAAELAASRLQGEPRGTLRLNAPLSFGVLHIGPALTDFMQRYPDLRIEVDFADRFVDLIEEGYDVAIRIASALPDSTLIARRLADNAMAVVASPDYWDRHGRRERPEALAEHACLTYRYHPNPNEWRFVDPAGAELAVRVEGRLQTNNGHVSLGAALAGLGVISLPRFLCGPYLASGGLEQVMADYMPPPSGIFALYPQSRHLSAKVRVFVDFMAERFGPACDWDRPHPALVAA
jgi:DNA-binding transcriptional LysR family regulator